MTDDVAKTPEQLAAEAATAQQASQAAEQAARSSTETVTPPGFVEQARYTGAVQTIEKLTTGKRDLEAQLATKTSDLEQLRTQLAQKDIEVTVAVGERDKNLQAIILEKTALEAEHNKAKAQLLKVEVAKELGKPELLLILGSIPDMTDKEALKIVMGDFVRFREDGVKERESQLLAGHTPALSSVVASPEWPITSENWTKLLNSLPLGSPDRAKAFEAYGNWAMTDAAKKR